MSTNSTPPALAPAPHRRGVCPRWALAAATAVIIVATGCQGSDVATGAVRAKQTSAFRDAGSVAGAAAGSICEVDSDCAALVDGPCVAARCDATSGRCMTGRKPDFSACDDGEPCSGASLCLAGGCNGVAATDCDDDNPCTTDSCLAGQGCAHAVVTLKPCSDGNPCTIDDRCEGGACVAAQNLCECSGDSDCDSLGNSCVGALLCVDGGCIPDPSTVKDCDDGQDCTFDSCDAVAGCVHNDRPDGSACADDSLCTFAERCLSGACVAAAKLPCDDGGLCPTSACDAALGCVAVAADNGVACDDGSPCTASSDCAAGVCAGVPSCACERNADCAGNGAIAACIGAWTCRVGQCEVALAAATPCAQPTTPCRIARCTALGCEVVVAPAGTACEDGNACTTADACDTNGACKAGTELTCDDGVDCTADACIASVGCLSGPSSLTLPCDDDNACTVGDHCEGLLCRGTPSGCDDGDPCTTDFCHPLLASCAHAPLAEGAICDDGNPCTTGESCADDACVASKVLGCDDGDACTVDACGSLGACTHDAAPAGTSCDDGDACSSDDACSDGQCIGGANTCACKTAADCAGDEDGNACNGTLLCKANVCVLDTSTLISCPLSDKACVTIACAAATGLCVESAVANGTACDDGDACTDGEGCLSGGLCKGGVPIACDDGDACSADGCDPATGCSHGALAADAVVPCDDGNPCTLGDVCKGGSCSAGNNACQCTKNADCAAFEDTSLCTAALVCTAGSCVPSAPAVACDASAGSPCVDNLCIPTTGTCALVPRGDNAPCIGGPGAGCLGKGVCIEAQCKIGDGPACADGDGCTADVCGNDGVCVNLPAVGIPCDDQDACTVDDVCDANGACSGGVDTCECKADADCPDDTDACNGVPRCLSGFCTAKPGTVVTCNTSGDTACATTACVAATGACVSTAAADGAGCDDGDACTTASACATGVCAGAGAPDCDDGALCTADGCNPANGCFHLDNTLPCDDGDPCTLGDVCAGGSCGAGPEKCQCLVTSDCSDDGDACNGVPVCEAGLCIVKPESFVVCDKAGDTACTAAICAKSTGVCGQVAFPDGTGCDDGDACTGQDDCTTGLCAGNAFSCDDANLCSDDACNATTGCTNTANTAPCDDGDVCTAGDTCSGGACSAGVFACSCVNDVDCTAKDDNFCDGLLVCTDNVCVNAPGSAVVCAVDGDSACAVSTCTPATGSCALKAVNDGTACDDSSACTSADVCSGGSCGGVANPACDDDNVCTVDSCDAALGCVSKAIDGGACDDGDACSGGDVCSGGSCSGGVVLCECKVDLDCAFADDGNLCNGVQACVAGKCVDKAGSVVICKPAAAACVTSQCVAATGECAELPVADGGACPDGDACTTGEICLKGQCVMGALDCDDKNVCTVDSCVAASGCVHKPTTGIQTCDDGDSCTPISICQGGNCFAPINTCFCQSDADCPDDADKCNGSRTCSGGSCKVKPGSVVVCAQGDNVCIVSSCVVATGACVSSPAPAGKSCNDGNTCTLGDLCTFGSCIGAPLGCDDSVDCTLDACQNGKGCVHSASDAACADGNACTKDLCDAVSGCLFGVAIGIACDDGDPCSGGELCQNSPEGGVCGGGKPLDCDDGTVCTTDSCNAFSGCLHVKLPTGTPCDDGNACTSPDACSDGAICKAPASSCDDSNACTFDVCDATDGCKNVAISGPCDDGDVCTTGEACSNGACISGPKNPLCCASDADCDDDAGCSVDACVAGSCARTALACADDGVACTVDTCVADTCASVKPTKGTPLVLYAEPFDDGIAHGIYVQSNNDNVTWQPSKQKAASAPASLYFGNPTTKNYDFGITQAEFIVRPIVLPKVGKATLKFNVFMDVNNNGCAIDKIQVFVNGALQVQQICASTTTFVPKSWSLAAFAGQTIEVRVRFDTVDAGNNTGEGAYVDDVQIVVEGADAGCCSVDGDCDDGSACTADSCDANSGACSVTTLKGYSNDFSNGLTGLATQSSNALVSWQADGKHTSSASLAAYVGNINLFGGYSYNFGTTLASLTLPSVAIPAGVDKAFVRAKVYFDSGENGACSGISDRVAITVGGQVGAQVCGDTNGFVTLEADVTASAGASISVLLGFLANPFQNNGEGAWIDDVEVGWTCANAP